MAVFLNVTSNINPVGTESKMTCQTVIVFGSTPVACELVLELQKKYWNPLFLCTNEILNTYWCGQVEEFDNLRKKVDEVKITKVMDTRLESLEYRDQDQLFLVKTNQGDFIAMCVVLCSESAIYTYRSYMGKYRGLFTCGVSKKIPDTLEDVEFHITLTTEQLRAKLVESASSPPNSTVLAPPPRKLLCCC